MRSRPSTPTVIAAATEQLPEGLDAAERDAIEQSLVAGRKRVDPAALRKQARRAWRPSSGRRPRSTPTRTRSCAPRKRSAHAKTRLTLHDNEDGTTTGHFTVPTLAGADPARRSSSRSPHPDGSPSRPPGARRTQPRAGKTERREVAEATWEAFRAEDARLVAEVRHGRSWSCSSTCPPTTCPARSTPRSWSRIDHDKLKASRGRATSTPATTCPPSEARRLAAAPGIVPAVLGGESQAARPRPVQRFFTEAQRVALALTYDTCAADDCDRPYAWTEQHHEDPWATGGRTDSTWRAVVRIPPRGASTRGTDTESIPMPEGRSPSPTRCAQLPRARCSPCSSGLRSSSACAAPPRRGCGVRSARMRGEVAGRQFLVASPRRKNIVLAGRSAIRRMR